MKIGVVGIGTVGRAVSNGFETLGHQVRRHDPDKGFNEDPEGDVIFICIYDYHDLDEVVQEWCCAAQHIVIKTTCPPGTTERLIEKYGRHICFSPEFVNEKTAEEDFLNAGRVIIGTKYLDTDYVSLIELHEPLGRVIMMPPTEAEMLKLAVNTFYCVKVTFANEVYDLCDKYNVEGDLVLSLMGEDRYINPQHLTIWHDGYRGFAGKCLPKDLDMFINAGGKGLCELTKQINDERTDVIRGDGGL